MKIGVGASKALSLLIVWCMIISSFAGLLIFTVPEAGQALSPSVDANGDHYIGSDYVNDTWYISGLQNLNGNLTIGTGGMVVVENGVLNFLSYQTATVSRVHHLTIEDGGVLMLLNSSMTVENTLYGAYNALGVLVRNDGMLWAENSALDFQGKVLIDDASFIAKGTQIYGPLMTAISSDVQLYDSSINGIPGKPTNVDEVYSYPFAASYNNTIDVDYTLERNPDALQTVVPDNDATNLTTSGSGYATIENLESMTISGFDIGGLVFDEGEAMSVRLMAEYRTSDQFVAGGTPDTFYYAEYLDPTPDQAANMQVYETYEGNEPALTNTDRVVSQDLTSLSLSSVEISLLTVTLTNNNADDVYIDRVWIEVVLTMPAYHNMTLAGTSELTAVNTMIGVNNLNYTLPEYRKLVATDLAAANLYGVEIDDEYDENGTEPFVTVRKNLTFKPTVQGADDTTAEANVRDLLVSNNVYYNVIGSGVLHVLGFDVSGLSGKINSAELFVESRCDSGYASSNYVQWNLTGAPLRNTSIIINSEIEQTLSYELPTDIIDNLNKLALFNVEFTNPDTQIVAFDSIMLSIEFDPTINVYRWVDINVVDTNDLPVSGAVVTATNSMGPATYYFNNTASTVPPQGVLDYLGRNSTNFAVTNDSGLLILPVLTDVINDDWAPNSMPMDSYSIHVTYVNATAVTFTADAKHTNFDAYPDLIPQVEEMEFVIDDLVLQLPDIAVIGFATDPVTIYQGDNVDLNFTVVNYGLTTASEFVISVRDVLGNKTSYLANITVNNLLPSESRNIIVNWDGTLTAAGLHNIVITADSLGQVLESPENEANNVLSPSVRVLEFLPDLAITSGSISFSQAQGYANQPMYINVTVSNVLGKKAANGVDVAFYIGNPMAGGVKQGNTSIDLPSGGSNSTSFLWTPTQIGSYSIYVWVNHNGAVIEYSYANNMASSSLEVILVAENGDWVVDTSYTMTSPTFSHQHNIIVEGNGRLTFQGTSVLMLRNETITQIVVRDNGTLILAGAIMNADFGLKIYIFDNGRLFVNSSTMMPNVNLIMDDDSQVFMHGSRVRGVMSAPSTSSVSLVTYNTTFDYAINDFGGNSVAVLTGSTIAGVPPVSPKDNAVIHLYSWIVAQVFDGTGDHPLANVHVEVRAFPATMYFTGMTDENGTVYVRALSAIVTASGPQLSGNYVLNATFWYNGNRYDSSESPIASVLYISTRALIRSDAYVRMDLPDAKPDIDPPFYVSDLSPLRGSEVTLSTVINNIGVVTGYNIVVRFSDVSATGTVIIEDYVVEILDPLSSVNVTVTWVAAYPLGEHNLTVTVDPLNEIPELNENNNVNYTVVEVLGVPDLSVVAADVDVGTEPARGREGIVTALISNLGDRTASNITIEFFDSVEGYIGNDTISNIPTGQKREATVSWTPLTAGDRMITVQVSMGNTSDEGDLTNNEAEVAVTVADYPDLVAMDVGFLVDGVAKNEANLNDDITVVAVVYNDGDSSALNFNVVFWLDGEFIIGTVNVTSLASKTTTSISLDWDPSTIPDLEQINEITMLAVVNPGTNDTYVHVTEMDDPLNANNRASQEFVVRDNRPDIAVTNVTVQSNNVNVTSGVAGEKIEISFTVRNIGLVDATNIKVGVYLDDDERMVLYEQNRNIAIGGSAQYDVIWTVNVSQAEYQMVIYADVGLDANITDNVNQMAFEVTAMNPDISISLSKVNYAPGDAILVDGRVTQGDQKAPLAGLAVSVVVTDSSGFPLTVVQTTTTDADGYFYAVLQTPSGKEGDQLVRATVTSSDGNFTNLANINIIAPFTPQSIPNWVYLLIVAIVIAVIVAFSFYLYKVGLGRMVECGNCGALIPEVSKHCPKCGVEFEADTAKCSECGAWIPAKAESCPDCGAKFMTEPLEGEQGSGYIEAMRKQYEEYVDGFRNQAKTALGVKYSEEKFQEWLQTEPNYLPFEEWLRKEEMSRRSGVFPCPTCGTLNPREAQVCNRCGTVFEQAKAEQADSKAEEKEKKSTFRRIVRRSAEEKPKEAESQKPVTPEEGGDKPQ